MKLPERIPPEALISVRGLTVEFRVARGILTAVDNVDLDVYRGEVLGLAGESGCGKSVLAHAILKLVDPNGYIKSGKILFKGTTDVLSLPQGELRRFRWKNAAIIFQGAQNALNPVMRASEHFLDTFLSHDKETGKEQIFSKSSGLIEKLRLDSSRVLRMFPHEMSGGMKQRTISALGMLLDPEFLILDEPTSSLDVLTQKYILKLLRGIHEETGLTMLFITHDLATLAEIAERIAIMYLGNMVEIGDVDEVFYEPRHPYTRVLLKALPSIKGDIEDIKPLPGPVPDPINPPSGCRFHPRCPHAMPLCQETTPKLTHVGGRCQVACHLYGGEAK